MTDRQLKLLPLLVIACSIAVAWATTDIRGQRLEQDKLNAYEFHRDTIYRNERERQAARRDTAIMQRLDTVIREMRVFRRSLCKAGIVGPEC